MEGEDIISATFYQYTLWEMFSSSTVLYGGKLWRKKIW